MIKISEWLSGYDSHGIYDSDGTKRDLLEKTGVEAPWAGSTHAQVARAIKERGVGGTLAPDSGQRLVSGFEMAEHLCLKLVDDKQQTFHRFMGRGSRFRAAVSDLEKAGF